MLTARRTISPSTHQASPDLTSKARRVKKMGALKEKTEVWTLPILSVISDQQRQYMAGFRFSKDLNRVYDQLPVTARYR